MAANRDEVNLPRYVRRSLEDEEEFHFLRFEYLQRLNITQLEVKLARLKSRIQREDKATAQDCSDVQKTLHDYATAIQDYKFLRGQRSVKVTEIEARRTLLEHFFQSTDDFNSPFSSHYSHFQDAEDTIDPLRWALMTYLPSRFTFSFEERRLRKQEYTDGKMPKEVNAFVDRSVRFFVAISGGLFLVVPMIIMALDASQMKSLVTVSAFVVLFALVLSFGVRVTNLETLVSTATYAAVLVVFVGTSTGGAGSSAQQNTL